MKHLKSLIISIFIMLVLSACQSPEEELVIFHAGSLSVPFKALEDTFESRHPDINVLREADGSVACARKITELNRKADLMASADIMIINEMLMPEYTDSAMAFAGNEMVIAFHEKAPAKDSITSKNWPQVLLHPEVKYGRSNPDLDPCGYRSILSMKLQENHLSTEKFVKKLLHKNRRFMRPKETDLLALLETESIDYMFIYKSVATQHSLSYLSLNDTVNLGNRKLKKIYKTAVVNIQGESTDDTLSISGTPMTYGICQLKNAPNPQAAKQFLELLKSPAGKKIIKNNGQNSLLKP